MSALYINREFAFNNEVLQFITWFDVPSDYFFTFKDKKVKLPTLKYQLRYADVYEKMQSNTSLEDMVEHFFHEFQTKNLKEVLGLIVYGRACNRTEEVTTILKEVKDYISIMLQRVQMD